MRHLILTVIALIITCSLSNNLSQAEAPIYSVASSTELANCVAGLTEDSTICLLADIEETVTICNNNDITVTIDGNKHTLMYGINISSNGNCNYILRSIGIGPMDEDNDEYASTCLHIFNNSKERQNEIVLENDVLFLRSPEIGIMYESSGAGTLRIENTVEAQAVGLYIAQYIEEDSPISQVVVCGHGKIIAEGTAPITCDGFLDDDYQVSGYGLSVSDLTLNGGQNTLATRMYFQRMNLTITDVQTDKPVTIRWDENYAIDAKDTNTKTIKDELTKYIKCTANNKPCKAEIIYSGDTNDTSEEYSGSFVVNK